MYTVNMSSIRRGHLIVLTTLFILCIRGGKSESKLDLGKAGIRESRRPVEQGDSMRDEESNPNPLNKDKSKNVDSQKNIFVATFKAKEQQVPFTTKPVVFLLADHPQCKDDVSRICEDRLKNNFAILDCLQNDNDKNSLPVSEGCQHVIWNYKKNLTLDNRFVDATNHVCQAELSRFKDCTDIANIPGHLISCLMDNQENMTDPQCKQYLTKMESIIFSDYRLIYKFADDCKDDINRLKCGRVSDEEEDFHSQHKTIDCLNEKYMNLTKDCTNQILRIAELQSDDFHLDRGLYYACREDREHFCKQVRAGEGKVYKCLMKHKMERDMSNQCREKLIIRQKLINQDYKVSHGLARACKDDIKAYKCRNHILESTREVKLSFILLCLEDAMHRGQPVTTDCQAEMFEHRRSLMEDYRINPNIVLFCDQEIRQKCNGLEKEGRTIHCLMKLAKDSWRNNGERLQKNTIGLQCKRELEALLKEVDPISDFRIDPALQESCQPVIETACRDIRAGDPQIITCLMDRLETDIMIDECEEHLLEIQYFIARDFRMDTRLYRVCHSDGTKYCNAPANWIDSPDRPTPDNGPLVFPCLYRLVYHRDPQRKISSACVFEVKRVMRQRAASVDLMPEIEVPCISDLSKYCSKDVERGAELECLQKNFKLLEEKCRNVLGNFTELEAENVELNHILMKACKPVIQNFCEDFFEQNMENNELMQCLISNKNNPKINRKCAAGIEHFQLISLKDYRFNFKFKEACKNDVIAHCDRIKTKADVVECLSSAIRDDILYDKQQRISKECKRQLKVELLQRNENINLDENLNKACKADVTKFCSDVSPENGQVLECLKNNRKDLSDSCHKTLFNREKEIMEDMNTDYMMMAVCKKMIKQFCPDVDAKGMLDCLKNNRESLDSKCKSLVLKRQIEQSLDYRFNPKLQKACRLDIPKFCSKVIDHAKDKDLELEGRVVNCLKEQFKIHKLSPDCEIQIGDIMRDAALNYQLNPLLSEVCKYEIKSLCNEELGDNVEPDGYGRVEECLKMKFQMNQITNETCKTEVAKLVLEGKADIHTDPILYKACALDIQHHCNGIPPGQGRQLSCMLTVFEDKNINLKTDCREKLKSRVEMFEFAAKVAPPDSINELVGQIVLSKSKNYFIIIICAGIGLFFIVGLFCGRVTKRVHAELKNK